MVETLSYPTEAVQKIKTKRFATASVAPQHSILTLQCLRLYAFDWIVETIPKTYRLCNQGVRHSLTWCRGITFAQASSLITSISSGITVSTMSRWPSFATFGEIRAGGSSSGLVQHFKVKKAEQQSVESNLQSWLGTASGVELVEQQLVQKTSGSKVSNNIHTPNTTT